MRTDKQIIADGDFVKTDKKEYQHVSGIKISYDCMSWRWAVSGRSNTYDTLEFAVYDVRMAA